MANSYLTRLAGLFSYPHTQDGRGVCVLTGLSEGDPRAGSSGGAEKGRQVQWDL